MNKKTLRGMIGISRYNNNEMERPITIRVTDGNSSIEFLEISLSLKEFALVMTGLSGVPCELNIRALDYVGKFRETKVEYIPVPHGWMLLEKDEKFLREYIKAYEEDGWVGSTDDLNNHYNLSKDRESMKVVFVRYVERKENVNL